MHTHTSYRVGTSLDDVLARPAARRCRLRFSLTRLGRAFLELFFAPWNAEATVFVLNQPRFDAHRPTQRDGARGHHVLRSTNSVATADQGGAELESEIAGRGEFRGRTSQSRSDRSRAPQAWGVTIRDGYGPRTETERPWPAILRSSRLRSDQWAGRCQAIKSCCSTRTVARRTRARCAFRSTSGPPV